jgi:hypothetical protein
VNADNKQTVPRITKIYQDMGVRCVGIVDFDALSDRTEFDKQLIFLGMEPEHLNKVKLVRDLIAKEVECSNSVDRLAKTKTKLSDLTHIQDPGS